MKRAQRNTARRLCASCGIRPALYRYHGHVKRDRTHVLCFQCYRAVRDSQRLAHPVSFPFHVLPPAVQSRPPAKRTGTND